LSFQKKEIWTHVHDPDGKPYCGFLIFLFEIGKKFERGTNPNRPVKNQKDGFAQFSFLKSAKKEKKGSTQTARSKTKKINLPCPPPPFLFRIGKKGKKGSNPNCPIPFFEPAKNSKEGSTQTTRAKTKKIVFPF